MSGILGCSSVNVSTPAAFVKCRCRRRSRLNSTFGLLSGCGTKRLVRTSATAGLPPAAAKASVALGVSDPLSRPKPLKVVRSEMLSIRTELRIRR